MQNCKNDDWEAKESQRQRELEEARARAAQMEKTMKWWSDCTSSWREKWSKVRNERNKAREELKQLRSSLEISIKEASKYKREKHELEKEIERIHALMMKHAGQFDTSVIDCDEPEREGNYSSNDLRNVNREDGLVTKEYSLGHKDIDIDSAFMQHNIALQKNHDYKNKEEDDNLILVQLTSCNRSNDDFLMAKLATLKKKLEDAQKTIQDERDEKSSLHKNIEKISTELQHKHDKCEEMRTAKQDAVRELLTQQEQHRAELRISNNLLQEETTVREAMERRLCELRTELERLQNENATEWAKCESLATEKLTLERENKNLRAEIQELQERFERRRPNVNGAEVRDIEFRTLQQELTDKCKEITDLRHSQSKTKKLLSETNTELGHTTRRAEQYETEVKRLRTRVEELKSELAANEDELDSACKHVRRLQRTNEDLTGQSSHTRYIDLTSSCSVTGEVCSD